MDKKMQNKNKLRSFIKIVLLQKLGVVGNMSQRFPGVCFSSKMGQNNDFAKHMAHFMVDLCMNRLIVALLV